MEQEIRITFEFDRETKRTYRFKEVGGEVVGTLYVKQTAFPDGPPAGLTVTITGKGVATA
jgi:hypothetical protein